MNIRKIALTAGLFTVFVLLTTLLSLTAPVHAEPNATITVNSAADPGDGTCNAQECTLKEAITQANGTVGVKETIQFNIPTNSANCVLLTGVCTIKLTSTLSITDPVVIDGYSQPGAHPNTLAVGNDAALKIVLDDQSHESALFLDAGRSTVKGLVIFHSELIDHGAIEIQSDRNVIQGNFIGTDVTGSSAEGNLNGIKIFGSKNVIGGNTPAARNLISGNYHGIIIRGSNNRVQGNYIGTDRHGLNSIPGTWFGIWVRQGSGNTIGGKTVGAGNVISGNDNGIHLSGEATATTVRGNYIGLAANGSALGNLGYGVGVFGNPAGGNFSNNNRIIYNHISANGEGGVVIGAEANDTSSGNMIKRNAIYNNGGLGIDIFPKGQNNANDNLDGDDGPNHMQNYPTVNKVTSAGGVTTIKGALHSEPNKSYRIEFFVNSPCEDNNHGEGKAYFGAVTITTNGNGAAKFMFTKSKALAVGAGITATATELEYGTSGSTSEFSNCMVAS